MVFVCVLMCLQYTYLGTDDCVVLGVFQCLGHICSTMNDAHILGIWQWTAVFGFQAMGSGEDH